MTLSITCPSCAAALDHGEVPALTHGIRVTRYPECACGSIVQLQALRGDTTWTAMAYKPRGAVDWFPMPDAKAFYARLDEAVKRG